MPTNHSNLYKFIASFGAVLFFFGLIFYYISTEQHRKQERDIRRNMLEYSHLRETYIGVIKSYEQAVIDSSYQELSAIDEQNIPNYKNQIDLRTKQLKLEEHFLDNQLVFYRFSELFAWGSCGAGLLLLIVSMIFWAVKLQRPVNNLLRREVRKKMNE